MHDGEMKPLSTRWCGFQLLPLYGLIHWWAQLGQSSSQLRLGCVVLFGMIGPSTMASPFGAEYALLCSHLWTGWQTTSHHYGLVAVLRLLL